MTIKSIERDNTAIVVSQGKKKKKKDEKDYWRGNMPKGFSARRSDATSPLSCQIELRSVKSRDMRSGAGVHAHSVGLTQIERQWLVTSFYSFACTAVPGLGTHCCLMDPTPPPLMWGGGNEHLKHCS